MERPSPRTHLCAHTGLGCVSADAGHASYSWGPAPEAQYLLGCWGVGPSAPLPLADGLWALLAQRWGAAPPACPA
eukprot:3179691-Alexandrium_andersonii.AAC.1